MKKYKMYQFNKGEQIYLAEEGSKEEKDLIDENYKCVGTIETEMNVGQLYMGFSDLQERIIGNLLKKIDLMKKGVV